MYGRSSPYLGTRAPRSKHERHRQAEAAWPASCLGSQEVSPGHGSEKSLLRSENEDQVEGFLARNADFVLLPFSAAWPGGEKPCDGDYMRLTPRNHNTDGFFAAVLVRKSA